MNYHKQPPIGLMSSYLIDQQTTVDQSSIDEEMVANTEATMVTPNELEEILSAWESLPDEAFLIY